MPGKAHEVATGGGSIGTVLVRLALTLMSSEEETGWDIFALSAICLDAKILIFLYAAKFHFFILCQISVFSTRLIYEFSILDKFSKEKRTLDLYSEIYGML